MMLAMIMELALLQTKQWIEKGLRETLIYMYIRICTYIITHNYDYVLLTLLIPIHS